MKASIKNQQKLLKIYLLAKIRQAAPLSKDAHPLNQGKIINGAGKH